MIRLGFQKKNKNKQTSEAFSDHSISSIKKRNKKDSYIKKVFCSLTVFLIIQTSMAATGHAETEMLPPEIVSESAVVIDAENGSVLYEKEADKTLYPASLTKIATAIYAIETGNLEDVATVSERARNADGTRVYLEEGEQVSLKKLVQGLLINSGNDAGIVIAEHLSGSVEKYAVDINKYLQETIGVQNSHFENPHGLFDEKHVTTARDLAKITQYAMKNDTFREIFGTKELKWDGESWDTTLFTHHKLLLGDTYEGVTGGKTGYVDESGVTLATTAERDGRQLIVITLNSATQVTAYSDTSVLLDYGFGNFQTSSISAEIEFDVEDSVFRTPGELSYTYLADTEVTQEVSTEGILNIAGEDGRVISSFALDDITKVDTSVLNEKEMQESASPILKNNLARILFIAAVFTLCAVGMLNRKSSRQQRYKKAR